MAGPTGFEPAISSVTGRRVRPTTPRALATTTRRIGLLSGRARNSTDTFGA